MSTVTWVARQEQRAQVGTLTVTAADTTSTITITVGGRKSLAVTPTTSNTTTTATDLKTALAASTEPEFKEITWTCATNVLTFTGPSDGAPITVAKTDGGTNATTLNTSVTAPLSPYDLNDAANYSGNALPIAGDDLVFEGSSADAKYNATALAGIALNSVTRRATHTGRIGLPVNNPAGYVEYRTTEVQFDAPTQTYEVGTSDAAGQIRVQNMGAAAVTLLVFGGGSNTNVGNEIVNIRGLPASSVVQVNGGSAAIAPLAGQTATVQTLSAQDATVWCGSGVTLVDATLQNSNYRLDCSMTTLTQVVGGTGEVRGSAACGAAGLKVYKGTLNWRSSGATGSSPVVGTGGLIDFSQAPTAVTVGGTVELNAGAGWVDPSHKCGSYNVKFNRCTAQDVLFNPGHDRTVAVT